MTQACSKKCRHTAQRHIKFSLIYEFYLTFKNVHVTLTGMGIINWYFKGALILDSCSNPAYALNQSLDFVRDMIGSTDLSEYQCRDGSHPESRQMPRKNVAAVVGGSYSSVTVQVLLFPFQEIFENFIAFFLQLNHDTFYSKC